MDIPIGRGRGADASLILARQLIAAKLNIASGSDPAPIVETISQADASLAMYPARLPYSVRPFTVEGREMTSLASALGDYNSGSLSPNCTPRLSANKPGSSRGQISIPLEFAIGSEQYTFDLLTKLTKPPVTVWELLRNARGRHDGFRGSYRQTYQGMDGDRSSENEFGRLDGGLIVLEQT